MPPIKLLTMEQWKVLSPRAQGYACYFQGSFPGSQLKGITCPYPNGDKDAKEFAAGEFAAMMDAQDGEE